MTKKLYWEQPYSQDFTAKIIGSDSSRVELDQTLFYPKGGGVSCDTGVLGGMKVVETSKEGDKILHTLESPASFAVTGNQIDVEKSRMDFSLDVFDRSQIEGFVKEANKLIANDAPVKSYFLDRSEALKIPDMVKLAEAAPPVEAQLRIVEIAGIDRQADGGLHVAHLNEIGRIELLKLENKGKTNRRLYYDVANA